MHYLGHTLSQARIGSEGLSRQAGTLAVRPVQGQLIVHAAGSHIRLHRAGIEGIGSHAEQLLIAPTSAVQVPQRTESWSISPRMDARLMPISSATITAVCISFIIGFSPKISRCMRLFCIEFTRCVFSFLQSPLRSVSPESCNNFR